MKINRILIGIAIALLVYTGISSFSVFSHITGSGNVIKENRELSQIHGIDVGGAFTIKLTQGSPQSVSIETDDNIMPNIKTKVKNGILEVSTQGNINNPTKMNLNIVVENIDFIDLSGACKLEGNNLISSNVMKIDCSGASEIEMDLKSKNLSFDLSGASKGRFEGSTKVMDIEASGASNLDCEQMIADIVSVEASGASNVSISANKIIKIDASGASNVDYKSNGATLEIETSGVSNAQKR